MSASLIFWIQSFVASSALILFALLVARGCRRSASTAHFGLMLTLVLIPVYLVANTFLQPYQLSVVSLSMPNQKPFQISNQVESGIETPHIKSRARRPSASLKSSVDRKPTKSPSFTSGPASIDSETVNDELAKSLASASDFEPLSMKDRVPSVVQILGVLWLAGVLLGILRLVVGGRIVFNIVSNAKEVRADPVGVDVRKLLLDHQIRLYESDQINSPLAIGVGRRSVILPVGFLSQFGSSSVGRALVHEAAHIIRHDQYWLLIQRFIGVVLWPHILVHLLNRAIDETREDVCDNFVLQYYRAVDYSRDLLQMSQSLACDGSGLLAPGLFSRRNLARRVSSLLSHQRDSRFSISRLQAFGIAVVLTITCGSLAALGVGIQEPALHQYVTDGAKGVFEPMFRSVEMAANCPSDLKLQIGEESQYRIGQIRYGSAGSTRVGFAVRFDEQGGFDLFLDRNRDRVITEQERVEGSGPTRTCRLDTEVAGQSLEKQDVAELPVRKIERRVIFRKSYSSDRIGFATVGYMEGVVELTVDDQKEKVVVRRVDATGNGLFNDSADRTWIDVDGNNEWDPVTEMFSPKPFIEVDGTRFAVKANEQGTRFQLIPNSLAGTVTLAPRVVDGAKVTEVKVMMRGNDLSAITIQGLDPVEVPTGTYRIENVEIVVRDPKTKLNSSFVFSSAGRLKSPENVRAFVVADGKTVEIDPIGELVFRLFSDAQFQRAEKLRMSPRLFTQDGLNLSSSFIAVGLSGTSNRESSVKTRVTNSTGKTIFGDESYFW